MKGFKTTIQLELCGYSVYCCGHRLQICTTGLVVVDDDLLRGRNTLVEFTRWSWSTNIVSSLVTLKKNVER